MDKKTKAILWLMKQKKIKKNAIENLPRETSDKEYLEEATQKVQADIEIINYLMGYLACTSDD